ncbi:hypothetical protein MCOR27_010766 [Pyricularia oryzae]|uniref:Uncharacterized protein n=3 Tax=Pyricularia TaxID=48558 RepID=A0ABQ8NJ49_PYRGI|nr:uncharacterized protein MGG_17464 [Pyricularia oryzae 70-15]KAH8841047.1 hypothetical protein MCOR01_007717 [Pyricularia oryzae]KAI6297884.1 hypothetical protein MCOR33_005886 [Pyricularia grisea]EHA49088.1 hypothetical protein MGG_17464 [Pyricularia oryzae 70-15]KAI6257473.1 hypothetical protein MCOR19_006086 [Pyricularia oryzae]KAI6267051.1 hypothetical protein MCOR27_010766 [Pyricularia oryzae]
MKFSATFIFALAASVMALPAPESDNTQALEARQAGKKCRLLITGGKAGTGTCVGNGRLCKVADPGAPGGSRTQVSSECAV